jgi:hypothetical protein
MRAAWGRLLVAPGGHGWWAPCLAGSGGMAPQEWACAAWAAGADSLTGDRLGKFNLTIEGHAACHK